MRGRDTARGWAYISATQQNQLIAKLPFTGDAMRDVNIGCPYPAPLLGSGAGVGTTGVGGHWLSSSLEAPKGNFVEV